MKKKKKEVENMKSKYRFRRILSGVMAAVTILSTVISPLTVYASEEPRAAEPPAYESVKDLLDENEVVKATDLELEVGQEFDVSSDRTNLEIKDESKVKVTFQKAENDAGESFSTSHADTYHAVYYVEPVNQSHPVYQIGRNLIVKSQPQNHRGKLRQSRRQRKRIPARMMRNLPRRKKPKRQSLSFRTDFRNLNLMLR